MRHNMNVTVSGRPVSIEACRNQADRAGSDIKAIPINPLQGQSSISVRSAYMPQRSTMEIHRAIAKDIEKVENEICRGC